MTLQEHLTELQNNLKRVEADYNAISGAIQFCEQLIKEQEKEEKDADS